MMIMRTQKTTREIWGNYWTRKFEEERKRKEEVRKRLLFGALR